ncbi:MAG: type II toxin-antitoxin system VapC family toxin [Pseudomonadota bacterium]|nr:type II toxin-antitoxin system VapC family toxin [Pseudomonadota bacterium]
MRPAVFDASVAVKVFLPVAGSDAAEAAAKSHAMVAPELVLVESANAFWKYVSKGLVPLEDCLTAIRNLSGFADLRPDRTIFPEALALANRLQHPVYDCVYLALALRTQFPLVSVDRKLLSLARDRLGIETIEPS